MNKTKYVLYSNTLENIEKKVENKCSYDKIVFYEKHIDRSDLSDEQKTIQNIRQYYRERNTRIYFSDDAMKEEIKRLVYQKIVTQSDENIPKVIHDHMYNDTKFRIVGWITDPEPNDKNKLKRLNISFELGNIREGWVSDDEENNTYDYSDDEAEFAEGLKDIKDVISSFSYEPDKYVYLEDLSAYSYATDFQNIGNKIAKIIKRVISTDYRYCFRSGKIIVPKEYTDKGECGIRDWQSLKGSNNKNNSIEKQMLRDIVRDKKKYAEHSLHCVMSAITKGNTSWSIPTLTVDGLWNKTRKKKLVNELLKDKSDQELIEMEKEDIDNIIREHWKGVLKKAMENVDVEIIPKDV